MNEAVRHFASFSPLQQEEFPVAIHKVALNFMVFDHSNTENLEYNQYICAFRIRFGDKE